MIACAYAVFLLSILLVVGYDKSKYSRMWYDPIYIILFVVFLYVTPLTFHFLFNLQIDGNISPFLYDLTEIFPFSLIILSISIIILYISYLFSPILKTEFVIFPTLNKSSCKSFVFLSYISLLISVGVLLIQSSKFGGIYALLLMGYKITEAFVTNPLLSLNISFIVSSSFLFFIAYIVSRKIRYLLLSLLIIAASCLILAGIGRRAEVAIWGGTYVIFYSLTVKPIKFKVVLPFILIAFIALNMVGYLRSSNFLFGNDKALIQRIVEIINNKNGLFYTVVNGQFAVPYETLPTLMKNKSDVDDFLLGSSVFDVILQWVPRFVWPAKPYGLASWYFREFYEPDAPPNHGRQFFFLSEGWMNFGIIGVFMWAAFWGFFWKNLVNLPRLMRDKALACLLVAFYTASILALVATDLTGLLVATPKSIFIFLFVYISSVKISNKFAIK